MSSAFSAVELAITEVTKARELISRKKSVQVRAGDEIDYLKSVAFTWFQTHRPVILAHSSHPDTTEADAACRTVLDSTGRNATRTIYSNALLKARRSLVDLRTVIASASPVVTSIAATTDAPPNFAPLASDPKMQLILKRRWHEVQQCMSCKANLAATVMMGGLLESLLLARLNGSPDKQSVFKAKTAPRDKAGQTQPLARWRLVDMVEVAHE